ncbi:MAG: hypothetical protein PHE49_06030 [bacterium]|nr:hypothetical protein [bacterium]
MPKYLRIIGAFVGLLVLGNGICRAVELSYDNGSVLGHRARVAG